MEPSIGQAAAIAESSVAQESAPQDGISLLEDEALNGTPSKAKTPDTFEIKVDGKITKVTLDELKKGYSLESAARRKMEEASYFKKENDYLRNVLRSVKEDPSRFVELGKALGVDVDELAIQIALKKAKYEMMQPHEKELHDYKEEVERLRRQSEKHQESSKKQEYDRHYNAATNELHDQIQSQCQALGLSPASSKSDRSLIHAAVQLVYDNFDDDTGRAGVSLEKALKHVKKQREYERQEYLSSVDNLPPEVLDRVRKQGVQSFKDSKMQPRQPQRQATAQFQKPVNVDDYFNKKEQMFKRKA